MKRLLFLGLIPAWFAGWGGGLQAQSPVPVLSPQILVVEIGSVDGRAILRGSGLEKLEEVRGMREGKTHNFVVGRPLALPDGAHELRILVRPDAPLGTYNLVAVTAAGKMAVSGTVEVVPVGDRRVQATSQGRDLNEAARQSRGKTIVADRDQVPQVTGTHPHPLMIAPDSQAKTIRLAGKNLERVTDVRIRKEMDEARYRQNQAKLPFKCVEGFLDIRVISDSTTPLGTKYWLDLMVENFRATSVLLEIGNPPPEAVAPLAASPAGSPDSPPGQAPGPRVIELPAPAPTLEHAP